MPAGQTTKNLSRTLKYSGSSEEEIITQMGIEEASPLPRKTQLNRAISYLRSCGAVADPVAEANLVQWLEVAPELVALHLLAYDRDIQVSDVENEQSSLPFVCPGPELTFRALELVGPSDVRVVILGQDPYHTIVRTSDPGSPGGERIQYKASGLAFGYHSKYHEQADSSLQNIIAEAGCTSAGYVFDRSLESWAEQGVLLLNTCLTVEAGRPLSHVNLGDRGISRSGLGVEKSSTSSNPSWQQEIVRILKYLDTTYDRSIMWLLWGAHAREIGRDSGLEITAPNVITTSHPCKYSNTAGPNPFTGSRCFERANEYLRSIGREKIKW